MIHPQAVYVPPLGPAKQVDGNESVKRYRDYIVATHGIETTLDIPIVGVYECTFSQKRVHEQVYNTICGRDLHKTWQYDTLRPWRGRRHDVQTQGISRDRLFVHTGGGNVLERVYHYDARVFLGHVSTAGRSPCEGK